MLFIDPKADELHTLVFINEFTKKIGAHKSVIVDPGIVSTLIKLAVADKHYINGAAEASVFRKLASFVAYFVALTPIRNGFPTSSIGGTLADISNHQNAIIAFEIARDSLHGARIYRDDRECVLENRIQVSDHTYIDIIEAFTGVTPSCGLRLVAVLLEQLAYRYNPDCAYPAVC